MNQTAHKSMHKPIITLNRRLRVAFMTTVGRNVGDEFIREGTRSFFDEILGAYDCYYVDKHDLSTLARPVYDEIDRLTDKFRCADVIVQAGAPVYWSNGRFTSCNSEWAKELWTDRIFSLGAEKCILNLGAGAGQKSEDDLSSLLKDEALADFSRSAGACCAWTTVRDPLAHAYLDRLSVAHEFLPCPAFHAARRTCRHDPIPASTDLLGINLMQLAGHYRLKPETDPKRWRDVVDQLLPRLRRRHRLLFIAHDQAEANFQTGLADLGENVFLACDYRDYISVLSRVKGIIANRVHGAVCAAGFGRAAVIVGNDCRIGIARPMEIPAIDSSLVTAEWIEHEIELQLSQHEQTTSRRIAIRDSSASRYTSAITEKILEHFPSQLAEAA